MSARFVIGIDLGTTNSVLAYTEAFEDRKPEIQLFEVPQLTAPGTVESRALLPSFIYLPGDHELAEGSLDLPWGRAAYAVGEFAREQGGLVADRLVSSSKSWLCHQGVDRRADILPWGNEVEASKLSPVEAARRVLAHFRDAWNAKMAADDPAARFELQDIVLTVPASFDEIARELTREAAREAGIDESRLVLLEEPQAAFYAWIGGDPEQRQELVEPGDKVLVVDMGGGTTDLSLFSTRVGEERVSFERTAVGEHLLLGGDNIDLAIARRLEEGFKEKTKKLSLRQWQALLQSCRSAKERLLSDPSLEQVTITLPGRGKKLIGGTIKAAISRADLIADVLEGFFPRVVVGDRAGRQRRSGLHEFGLPFEAEPAVTRHLLGFLEDHCEREGALEVPRALLFNGGVFKTEALRERVSAVLGSWMQGASEGAAPLILTGSDLDTAVAWGAAYYGLVRRGYGLRIRGGLPRSYYMGLEAEAGQRKALCLIPQGLEEGEEVEVSGHDLVVRTRRPVRFPLYTSTARAQDRASELVDLDDENFRELPPLHTVLKLGRKSKRPSVPVRLSARLTEIGTLEAYCRSIETDHSWRLDFTVRGPGGAGGGEGGLSGEERAGLGQACLELKEVYGSKLRFDELRPRLEGLVKSLEERVGARRDQWPLVLIRGLYDEALSELAPERTRSALHESRWLNLVGFCLRPGFGSESDEHRVKALWKVYLGGMKHANNARLRVEWLVALRRICGGLAKGQQEELLARLGASLKLGSGKKKGALQEELNESWRLAVSLENVSPSRKRDLGNRLLEAESQGRAPRCFDWALGRLGARVPVYGTLDNQLSGELVEGWIEALLPRQGKLAPARAFCLVQLGRVTDQRGVDIDAKLRAKLCYQLRAAGCEPGLLRYLEERVETGESERVSAFGDSIPAGLKLA